MTGALSRSLALGGVIASALAIAACSLLVDASGLSGGSDPSQTQPQTDASTDAPAQTDAGGDAAPMCDAAVDLSTDAKSCGRCGHDCLGGACVGARCQPVSFAVEADGPAGVATDGTEIFWSTFGGAIRAKRLDGAGATRQVATVTSAAHIEVDDTYVYLSNRVDHRILRVPKAGGGSAQQLAICAGECLGVALFGGTVYYTDRGTSTLRIIGPDGGSPVASGLNDPEDAFATETDVFVANEAANTIVRVPRDGAPSSQFLPVTDPVSFAIEGSDLFIASQGPGIIYRRPVAGGSLDAIATGQARPVGLVATRTAVYWANLQGKQIMRLAR